MYARIDKLKGYRRPGRHSKHEEESRQEEASPPTVSAASSAPGTGLRAAFSSVLNLFSPSSPPPPVPGRNSSTKIPVRVPRRKEALLRVREAGEWLPDGGLCASLVSSGGERSYTFTSEAGRAVIMEGREEVTGMVTLKKRPPRGRRTRQGGEMHSGNVLGTQQKVKG